MGHQEPSPPRSSRQRRHHHRHGYRHCHGHQADSLAADFKQSWTLRRLNRESHTPNSRTVVNGWLGQIVTPVFPTQLASPEPQGHLTQNGRNEQSRDSHASPCRRARRVDRSWQPRHIPPTDGCSPPRFPSFRANPKRFKRDNYDSSLISDLSHHEELGKLGSVEFAFDHEESSHGSLDEAESCTKTSSSPKSHAGGTLAFEKRPRHKTRADKYDTKKSGDGKKRKGTQKQDDNGPNKPKSKKRKHPATGKNVMSNFNSGSILNDRITVQPSLKPRLFGNKRVPQERLITDLSFSEMPLPMNQERDTIPQKGLSSSRLREKRRERRELEQISSLFLPASTNKTARKVKPAKMKGSSRPGCTEMMPKDTVLSPHYSQQPMTSPDPRCSVSDVSRCNLDRCTVSGRTTTYLTWSSSPRPPEHGKTLVETRPKSAESARSITPENIQRALIATGVHDYNCVHGSGASEDQQNRGLGSQVEFSPMRKTTASPINTCTGRVQAADEEPETHSKSSSDARSMLAAMTRLKERWNTILPAEWRLRVSSEVDVPQQENQQKRDSTDTPTDVGLANRQEVAQEARMKPIRRYRQEQGASSHTDRDSHTNQRDLTPNSVPVSVETGQTVDRAASSDQDRTKLASRDAMPPPPLPPYRFNSLHLSNQEQEVDPGAMPCTKPPDSPVDTHFQVFGLELERPQVVDTYEANQEQHQPDGSPEMIPTVDPTPWIPYTTTTDIVSYERDQTRSRLSMRSPIYENQCMEEDTWHILSPKRSPTQRVTESMADFITRIESEIEDPISPDQHYQSESMTRNPGLFLDPIASTHGTYNLPLMTPEVSYMPSSQRSDKMPETGSEDTPRVCYGLSKGVATEAASRNRPIGRTTEVSGDEVDRLEMSNFWGPNRFAHN
ncbi:hypothetical protein F4777DRAFT_199855 [Nemania sp. FL0916]|nr:hypothetical protein F4777DRAFT_199855 [Nemania sp. FL0916]